MQTFSDYYKLLNPEQKKAVDTIEGPVFVMAGPGTGKTQILTLRIANILQEGAGVDPENILALTFTNTAAYNMRERLSQMIGVELAHRVHISTFHSFAEDMIKQNIDFFPDLFQARLASEIERIKILEDILDDLSLHYFSVFKRRDTTMSSLVASIDKIKYEGLTPDEFIKIAEEAFEESMNDEELFYKRAYKGFKAGDMKPAEKKKRERQRDKQLELAQIYAAYQDALHGKHLYDFSDLIVQFIHAMREHDDFRAEMQERFQYILVDEHQDTNDAQNTIIHLLIDNPVHEGKPNLFVVGDNKQAIYRFAGASQESFERLKKILDDMRVIDLVHNYRSGQHVLDQAHHLIQQSDDHAAAPALQAHFKEHTGVIEYREFSQYKTELVWLAQHIQQQIEEGHDPNEIAVLYRNNRDAYDVQQILGAFGVPFQDLSKKNILEDPDMIKLFLLFRSLENLDADDVLARVLYIDFLNIDVSLTQAILRRRKYAKKENMKSIFALLDDEAILKELGAGDEGLRAIKGLTHFLKEAQKEKENKTFLQYFTWFIRESGFLAYMLSRPNAVYALAKIEKLFDEVKKESAARDDFSFQDFTHYIASLKRYDIKLEVSGSQTEGVRLMTLHGAKGLEFESVYIIKAVAKRKSSSEIPLPFGDFETGYMDDERRLFYVGLTRAKKNIFITSHVVDEQGKEKTRSPFVDQIEGLTHVDVADFEKESQLAFAEFFNPVHEPLQQLTSQEYIQEKFLSSTLSVSALNNYVADPLLYFFRNLLHIPEAKTPHLEFGNLVHGSLERYFNMCKEKGKVLEKEALLQSLDKTIISNAAYEEFEDRARGVLSDYFDQYEKDFVIPIENEQRVNAVPFQIAQGETIKLTGVMDKIIRDKDGNIVVWDYKTGKTYAEKDKEGKEAIKRQAVFYKLLLMSAFDGKYSPAKVVFDFVQPSEKTGEYERQEFAVTQEDVAQLSEEIHQLAEDIFNGTLLKHQPEHNHKTKSYIELLNMIQGDVVQQSLFGE